MCSEAHPHQACERRKFDLSDFDRGGDLQSISVTPNLVPYVYAITRISYDLTSVLHDVTSVRVSPTPSLPRILVSQAVTAAIREPILSPSYAAKRKERRFGNK